LVRPPPAPLCPGPGSAPPFPLCYTFFFFPTACAICLPPGPLLLGSLSFFPTMVQPNDRPRFFFPSPLLFRFFTALFPSESRLLNQSLLYLFKVVVSPYFDQFPSDEFPPFFVLYSPRHRAHRYLSPPLFFECRALVHLYFCSCRHPSSIQDKAPSFLFFFFPP